MAIDDIHRRSDMAKRYSVSRDIDASAETVWGLLTDSSGYADWNRSVLGIEGPIAAGRTIKLVSVASPKRTFKLKVATMEPPRRMVWASGMPLGLFRGLRTYLVETTDSGTSFSMTEEFSGPLSGLITKSIPDLTDSFNQFADGLKIAAEAKGRP
jgi:hypothetical protein